jgi:hypothetical protein
MYWSIDSRNGRQGGIPSASEAPPRRISVLARGAHGDDVQEVSLADARFTGDQHDARPPIRRGLDMAPQRPEFTLPPDQQRFRITSPSRDHRTPCSTVSKWNLCESVVNTV